MQSAASPGAPSPAGEAACLPPAQPQSPTLPGAPSLMPSLAYQVPIQPPVMAPDVSSFTIPELPQTDAKPPTPVMPDRHLYRNRQESLVMGQGWSSSGLADFSSGAWDGGRSTSPAPIVRSRESTRENPTFQQARIPSSPHHILI